MVVIGTFGLVWLPYLQSKVAVLEVLSRLAPFERGIYEDYVANFWYTTSVLIKWKRLFTTPSLKLLSLTMTVSSCLPSMFLQIRSPSNRGFLYGQLNSAFSFYLFSFQVHEKSILLPLLPATILAVEEPFVFQWFTQFALLSMFPLLIRDKLLLPYIALYVCFGCGLLKLEAVDFVETVDSCIWKEADLILVFVFVSVYDPRSSIEDQIG
ncbi:ALG6, ALG8 glycosyltransferase family [Artemisia annua]|uniref:Alpha-1,3-glucosyltransferase n=1 Tax=Artemisia annua TaxID=35608 RepID=A0A2U1PDR7_ARTAN|nr:ALG6, ALG8 glycosyltransferase family [Artemisia annua]